MLNNITWLLGYIAAVFIGLGVYFEHGYAYGITTAFTLSVLVDMRAILNDIRDK